MNPEWEELEARVIEGINREDVGYHGFVEVRKIMDEIERRTLPERVAEILENCNLVDELFDMALSSVFPSIAKALRSGDLSEIEKWVKK